MSKLVLAAVVLLLSGLSASAQDDDGDTHIFRSNIRSVQLFAKGSQIVAPIIQLSGGQTLTLQFDDLDGDIKNYAYSYELRNADWSPASLNVMEYTKGFSGAQISDFKASSIAITKYTHYGTYLPDPNYVPTKGGNYLLKVYQNGDPSDVVFQVRMLVVNSAMQVAATVQPPFSGDVYKTHQKVDFTVGTGGRQFLSVTQEVKVTILQNWNWATAHYGVQPTNVQNGMLQYNTENDAVMPGTREWRWLDIRSFRFQSDRIAKLDAGPGQINVNVRTDQSRKDFPFVVYQDQNGSYTITATEGISVQYQGDYSHVTFTYAPPDGQPYDKELYIYGALGNYELSDSTHMHWDPDRKVYRITLFLKQGYYDYFYVLKDSDGNIDMTQTEGNFFETENQYLILVYYRPLGGRFDELVGLGRVNSLASRNAQTQ